MVENQESERPDPSGREPVIDSRQLQLDPLFVGRRVELERLLESRRRFQTPMIVTGPPGVGKTALVQRYIASVRTAQRPIVLSGLYSAEEAMARVYELVERFSRDRDPPEIVVIDDSDALNDRQLSSITGRIFNFKAVRQLIFIRRIPIESTRAEILNVGPLSEADADELFRKHFHSELPSELRSRALEISGRIPLALTLVARLLNDRSTQDA